MKIRITGGHCIGGGKDVYPGDVLEVDEKFGAREIRMGWAVEAKSDEPITRNFNTPAIDHPVEPAQLSAGGEGDGGGEGDSGGKSRGPGGKSRG